MNNRPIFILGAPRSGNTLFRMILSSHSRICIPPESQFLHYLDPIFHSTTNDKNKIIFNSLLNDTKFADWQIDENILSLYIEQSLNKEYAEFISGIYQLFLDRVNRKYAQWGDKNPSFLFKIDRILELYPKALIILLIREPLSIYGSLKRVNFFGRDTKIAINDYYRRIKCVSDSIFEYNGHPNIFFVNYSSFVAEPENNTKILIKRLGYDFEPEMLNFHDNKSFIDEMLQSKINFHKNLLKPISGSFIDPNNYNLEESEVIEIESKLENELRIIRSFIQNNPSL